MRAVAHGVYRAELRELIHLMKYDGMRPVAGRLAELLAVQVAAVEGLPKEMTVIAVPLFRGKRRERAFNQAELLARGIVRALRKIRPELRLRLATDAMERRRATENQAGLSAPQRRRNVRGAFSVPDLKEVRGRDLLLIDDIYTTGATARACAHTLRKAGATSVLVATVARAQLDEIGAPAKKQEVSMEKDVAVWDAPVLRNVETAARVPR